MPLTKYGNNLFNTCNAYFTVFISVINLFYVTLVLKNVKPD